MHINKLLILAGVLALAACSNQHEQQNKEEAASAPEPEAVFTTTDAYEAGHDGRPWTHLNFANDPDNFQFAIITDRTGGHRPGVFPAILEKVNLMQPEFIMSVGDYIEGYHSDKDIQRAEWAEMDGMLEALEAPLFLTVGNHDVSNLATEEVWRERAQRTYYHFKYKDVLFLVLNTEDAPYAPPEVEPILQHAVRLAETDLAAALEYGRGQPALGEYMQGLDQHRISDDQLQWALDVLAANQDVRWTFVFMHRPVWTNPPDNFGPLEQALAGRGYTMLAGHVHNYTFTKRQGNDYISLATSGGMWSVNPKPREMDHITWVTMRGDEPVFANLVATGILAKDQVPETVPGAEFCGPLYDLPCRYGPAARPQAEGEPQE